jgi:uncharacterized protein (DUF433 family)
MKEANIIVVGRGPQIEGTRITVFDIVEYHTKGWHRDEIAVLFDLSSQQVEAAIRYIEEHRDEVMADYARNIERINRSNPPEIQAKLDAGRERLQALVRERQEAKAERASGVGHSDGQGLETNRACRGNVLEAETMLESNTITVGNNPRITGTRISVYAILEYLEKGWHRDQIAVLFRLGSGQVEAAIRYIEEHREEVMAEYDKIMARIARGNPPELQAKLDAVHGTARARLEELRRAKSLETADERHSGGQ